MWLFKLVHDAESSRISKISEHHCHGKGCLVLVGKEIELDAVVASSSPTLTASMAPLWSRQCVPEQS